MVISVGSWLTSTAYGQNNDNATLAVTAANGEIKVEAAPPANTPAATFFGNTIGGVTACDLFYVNATDSPLDISVDLYIANPNELIHYLKYLILKVAVYVEDIDGQWKQITSQDGTVLPDIYITLQNSPVTFILPGAARYKVTIESGSYYCLPFNSDKGEIAPSFYLNVESASFMPM